ncbi:hypothetical protein [Chryseobacterium sp. OSA05B]|uniref:hypothetical protein n=1 Tax=Chryseobacterium sp. OSA05B TaxID=2862650 RepID=UPI001CBC5288|nr:hypothetical protein [Chryseobacterium sp. OSA05B]
MNRVLFVLFFLFFLVINSQVRQEIYSITDSICEAYNKIPTHHISEKNSKDINQLQRFRSDLALKAKDHELVYIYKNDSRPLIKIEVLKEIFNRNQIDKLKLFKETVHFTDEIKLLPGEELYPIQCIFFDKLTYDETSSELSEDLVEYVFRSEPLNLSLIENIQHKIPSTDKYYKKVRKLTIENRSVLLLSFIASLKNEKDIDLIKSFGINSFAAIQVFPDEQFIPFLESLVKIENLDHEYLSLAARFCKDPKSNSLIYKIFETLKGSRAQLSLFESLLKDNKCRLKYEKEANLKR